MTTLTTPEYISVSVNYVGLNELLDRLLQRQTVYYNVKRRQVPRAQFHDNLIQLQFNPKYFIWFSTGKILLHHGNGSTVHLSTLINVLIN